MTRITTLPSKEDVSKKFKKKKKVNFSEHRILEKSEIIPNECPNKTTGNLETPKYRNYPMTGNKKVATESTAVGPHCMFKQLTLI